MNSSMHKDERKEPSVEKPPVCEPSRIHPEEDGPDHTALTKRTNTESNERGERRGERRGHESMNGAEDQAPSVRPRGTSQRRRARAATRFDPVVTQDKLIQGAPTNVSTIGGLVRARAVKARASLRTLLLVVPLLLLLVAMLLLLVLLEADLVTMSVLIVGRRDTTRTRAPNCLLRTRSGIMDGRYWFWPVLQSVHPQGERERRDISELEF